VGRGWPAWVRKTSKSSMSPSGTRSKSREAWNRLQAMPRTRRLRGNPASRSTDWCRENAGVGLDEFVLVRKTSCRPAGARRTRFGRVRPPNATWTISAACSTACRCRRETASAPRFSAAGGRISGGEHHPRGPVPHQSPTRLVIGNPQQARKGRTLPPLTRISAGSSRSSSDPEMIELPLRYPEVFEAAGHRTPPRACCCMVRRAAARH